MSARSQAAVIFWTQPLDPMEEDLIQVRGQIVPPLAAERRQKIVGRITTAAERGKRTPVGDGAWVARYQDAVICQVPTSTADGQPGAPVITCVSAKRVAGQLEPGDLVTELTEFGRLVGYEIDKDLARQTMSEVARNCRSRPFRFPSRLRTALQWLWAGLRWLQARLWSGLRWLQARLWAGLRWISETFRSFIGR